MLLMALAMFRLVKFLILVMQQILNSFHMLNTYYLLLDVSVVVDLAILHLMLLQLRKSVL